MRKRLTFDIETHTAKLLYTMPAVDFVRLTGYSWDEGPVVLTTDLEEIRAQIRSARWIMGHNIHSFDLSAVFGPDSDEPLELAMQKRVYDTWTHAVLVHPAPPAYLDRDGKPKSVVNIDAAKRWFSLDNQAFQLGVKGKTDDIRELAYEFGPEDYAKEDRITLGFGMIPVDEPRYRDYLVGDVRASSVVAKALLRKGPLDDYAMREQEIEARKAVIAANGFRVHQDRAEERVKHLAGRRDVLMEQLVERYNFPTSGKKPWAGSEGKSAVMALLADQGVTPKSRPDWTKTPAWKKRDEVIFLAQQKRDELAAKVADWQAELGSGELTEYKARVRLGWIERAQKELCTPLLAEHFGLSLSGDTVKELTADTDAADTGKALAELMGQRTLAQLALDSVHPDGRVHPNITMLQASARWSTTDPGLTVWTSRGEGAVEKSYFLPDSDDDVLLEIDYSNADARAVAAYSGDTKFAERFEPGQDGHMINALIAWGAATVATDPKGYRQKAKVPGHGWGYRIGPATLARQTGLLLKEAKTFLDRMNGEFKGVVGWQDRAVRFAARHGFVVNAWGRKLYVEKGREYTQAPAQLGQNATREIVCDALLAMPVHVLRRVKAQIHDALLFSVPRKNFEACRDYLIELMTATFHPEGGQRIEFPCEAGPPGEDWQDASHV